MSRPPWHHFYYPNINIPDTLNTTNYLHIKPHHFYQNTQDTQTKHTMTGSKLETAALAASAIACADQLMLGVRDHREGQQDEANSHYVRAAIAGAIAVGAFALLKKDENQHRDEVGEEEMGYEPRTDKGLEDRKGHMWDLAAEAAGAYALGRQMMGHKNHAIVKLIAEGLGAAALGKETERTVVD